MHTEPVRRKHPRVPAGFLVKLHVKGRTLVQKARNLSMTGLLLDCDAAGIGDRVLLEINLPDEDRAVAINGQILRSSRPYGTSAIRFLDLDWDDMFALARYLAPRLP